MNRILDIIEKEQLKDDGVNFKVGDSSINGVARTAHTGEKREVRAGSSNGARPTRAL